MIDADAAAERDDKWIATLTDNTLKALKPRNGKARDTLWDESIDDGRGFGVRVTDKGNKTFVLRRRCGGPTVRLKLGRYPAMTLKDARRRACDWLEKIEHGIDPAKEEAAQRRERERVEREERDRRENTFKNVAETFIKEHVSKKRSRADMERLIRRELIPAWGDRPVAEVAKKDVIELLRKIRDRKPRRWHSHHKDGSKLIGLAHATHALVRKFFNWAIANDLYQAANPCATIDAKNLIGAREVRQRVLSNAEVRVLWQATKGMGDFGPFIRFLLITGQRLREVSDMKWSEIDGDVWTIPPERFKSGHSHEVPLSPLAMELLASLPRYKSDKDGHGTYVFTTTGGKRPVSGFSKAKTLMDDRIARMLKRIGGEFPAWRFHDLRRTMRTRLSALPVEDLVRELCIGHLRPGLHKVYDQHQYRDEKRRALELWADRLQIIVKPLKSNVAKLREAS